MVDSQQGGDPDVGSTVYAGWWFVSLHLSLLLLQTHLVGDLKHTGPGKATFFFFPFAHLCAINGECGKGEVKMEGGRWGGGGGSSSPSFGSLGCLWFPGGNAIRRGG